MQTDYFILFHLFIKARIFYVPMIKFGKHNYYFLEWIFNHVKGFMSDLNWLIGKGQRSNILV